MRNIGGIWLICSWLICCGGPQQSSDSDASLDDSGAGLCVVTSINVGVQRTTLSGSIEGQEASGVFAFKGIPYARPPLGELRWSAPRDLECSDEVFQANFYGSPCPQMSGAEFAGEEDCLTLNVWTHAATDTDTLPVLVFLHGGFNVRGSSGEAIGGIQAYNGEQLARRGAVVVSANYRLGALGFLAHPAFEADGAPSGNFALKDQLAALSWVQGNISAFGGDPTRVLLFGQSAGSIDTCSLLASPAAEGLFSRAMMLSGACVTLSRSGAEEVGEQVVSALGCAEQDDTKSCLQALTPEQLTRTVTAAGLHNHVSHPYVDGELLLRRPIEALASQPAVSIPTIISTTTEEMKVLATGLLSSPLESEQAYQAAIGIFFDEDSDEFANLKRLGLLGSAPTIMQVLAIYPSSIFPSFNDAFIAVLSDFLYSCPARRALRALRASGNVDVWQAVYDHSYVAPPLDVFGASHGFDIFFGFGNHGAFGQVETSAERELSRQMTEMWVRFAATGNPNHENLVAWPSYDLEERFLQLDTSVAAGQSYRADRCNFWDSL